MPAPGLLFTIPPTEEDAQDLRRLPAALQTETRLLLARLQRIHAANNKSKECDLIAAELLRIGKAKGNSKVRLYTHYFHYVKGWTNRCGNTFLPGDWRSVVNWAKAGPRGRTDDPADALPADFLNFWRKLCENHQRVSSEAWRELIQIWETGMDDERTRYKAIPGYATWPEREPKTLVPRGWTYKNLMRHAPDAFERTAARVGIQAASQVGLKLRFSRKGVKVGEFISFDDHEFNVKVNFPGQMRSMRPRCFGAAEYVSGCCFNLTVKPTLWDADEQAKKVLTETDFMWFVVAILTDFGFRADTGTTFLVEHGTAAIREEFEQRIRECTGGAVKVDRSGRFHRPAHGGQFAAPSGGNFRFKPIEQYWRMIDDRLDGLVGQSGTNAGSTASSKPEELERADAYVSKLLKYAATLPVEQAAQLIIQRLTWNEFLAHAWDKRDAINDDFNHAMRNWEKCGFVTKEFRLRATSNEWFPQAALQKLPEPQRLALAARIAQDDLLFRVRKLSRAEALAKHQHELTKLPLEMIPALVGQRFAWDGGRQLPVTGGKFMVKDWRISSDPIEFIAADLKGERLREDSKWLAFVNPMSPHILIACDPALRVIGLCPLMPEPAKNDAVAVKHALGLQRSWFKRALAPMNERHAADAEALDFMKQHNAALLPARVPAKPAPVEAAPEIADCSREILDREEPTAATDDWS